MMKKLAQNFLFAIYIIDMLDLVCYVFLKNKGKKWKYSYQLHFFSNFVFTPTHYIFLKIKDKEKQIGLSKR